MRQFLEELKRRKVDRVAIAYLAVAWLVVQIAETLLPVYGFTDVAIRNLVAVLGTGFIVAILLSWSFEWTPEGIFKDSAGKSSSRPRAQNTKGLDRFIIAALTAAVAFFAIDKFLIDPARDAREIEAATVQARQAALADKSGSSIAVLPFANRSNRDDDVYFVDGIHDDILTQLARIDALAVTSRTSVEQYRSTELSIRDIGTALDVRTILEGGIQRAGDRVRINVQLIDARNDQHLWAETYERELTAANIFSVQADIATRVADAMRVTLLPDEREALADAPTESYQAYDLYLLGRYHWNKRTKASVDLARQYFEQAIEIDPDYVLALSGLADSYIFQVEYGTATGTTAYPLAEELIERAMALDDESSEVWASLGLLQEKRRQWAESERAFRRAIELDRQNAMAWHWYAHMLWVQHRYADAIAAGKSAYALEPMSWAINNRLANYHNQMGEFETARQHFQRADEVRESQSMRNTIGLLSSWFLSGDIARAVLEARRLLYDAPDDLNAMWFMTNSSLLLGDFDEARLWARRGVAVNPAMQEGARIAYLERDYAAAIAGLEDVLERNQPHRDLWVLHFLFKNHYRAGDMAAARRYAREYVDAQQGRLEFSAAQMNHLEKLEVAAFLIRHGDTALEEPALGRQIVADMHRELADRNSKGWLHPLTFMGLAATQALREKPEAALAMLHDAIDSGFRNQLAGLDNLAFDGLREHPEFLRAIGRIEALLAEERKRLAAMELPPYRPPVSRENVTLPRETLERYAGWYSDGNFLVNISVSGDGQLKGTVGQGLERSLPAVGENEFYFEDTENVILQFVIGNHGKPSHLLVKSALGEALYKAVDAPRAAIELPRDMLARYEGSYSHDKLGDIDAERTAADIWGVDIHVDEAGKIWFDLDDQPKIEVQPISETEFDIIGFVGEIEFEIDPTTGRANRFVLLRDGREFLFTRD